MRFYRLSGAGNDFLALVEPQRVPEAGEIAGWCRRGHSIGADGLFVLRRDGDGTVAMDYWNADGLPAALCLNGTRCAARLAFELGWSSGRLRIRTGAGEVNAERAAHDPEHEIALEAPLAVGEPVALRLDLRADPNGGVTAEVQGHRVMVGVPHFVVECTDVARAPVSTLGPAIRHHVSLAPDGANAHFVRYHDRGFAIRSWERGVEAETLACGSGVLAAAAVGIALGRSSLPLRARTRGGFVLQVEGADRGGGLERWRLTGDARLVARGELLPAASRVVTEPAW